MQYWREVQDNSAPHPGPARPWEETPPAEQLASFRTLDDFNRVDSLDVLRRRRSFILKSQNHVDEDMSFTVHQIPQIRKYVKLSRLLEKLCKNSTPNYVIKD